MHRKHLLLGASVITAAALLSTLSPRQLLAQVRAALVRDVDNPARQPVRLFGGFAFVEASAAVILDICAGPVPGPPICGSVVPAGKMLVIESISVRISLPHGQVLESLFLRGSPHNPSPSFAGLALEAAFQGTSDGRDRYTGTHLIRAYVGPGTEASVHILRSASGPSATFAVHGYGYLVDLN